MDTLAVAAIKPVTFFMNRQPIQSPDHPAATKRYPNSVFEWYSIFSNPHKRPKNQWLLTRFVFVFKVHYIVVLYELHCRPDITKHVGEPHRILCFFVIIQQSQIHQQLPERIIRTPKIWFCTVFGIRPKGKQSKTRNCFMIICSSSVHLLALARQRPQNLLIRSKAGHDDWT